MKTLKLVLCDAYNNYPSLCRRDIQEILAFVLKMKKEDLFLSFSVAIETSSLDLIEKLLKERVAGKPLAYLLGYVDFYGCRIAVDSSVLIPRVETEILLEKVLDKIKYRSVGTVFDICCGSGCLGIAFKKQRKDTKVYLSDLSEFALNVANENAKLNDVEVICLDGDLLDPFKGVPKADLVFCNPPYISDKEYFNLESSVKDFEPRMALTSGPSGLEFFKRLSVELPMHLNSKALVALEIGFSQKKSVIEIFSTPLWRHIYCEQDYAGLDRFIFLEVE